MNTYDEDFARRRARRHVESRENLSCEVCNTLRIDTASQYEWPCLILRTWICETHCAEVKLNDYEEMRDLVRKIVTTSGRADSRVSTTCLLEICARCPYGGV